jgi:hypothetical protein
MRLACCVDRARVAWRALAALRGAAVVAASMLAAAASADAQERAAPEVCLTAVVSAPSIDGVLDDAAWTSAAVIEQWTEQRPRDGAPASDRTTVRLAYDASHLYVAIHSAYSDPSSMRANLGERDRLGDEDVVALYFDPFLDRQRAFRFAVNGYGVQADGLLSAGGDDFDDDFEGDESWDALFESKGRLVADGWVAELAIPFKSLRYPDRRDGEHRWGFQVLRRVEARDAQYVWAPMSRDVQGFLTQMGILCGLRNLSTSRNLELLPTIAAVRATARDRDSGALVHEPVDPSIGLNVKYGITSDLTLDVAINPDFSQIEADRPQITLNQRFPLFYEEKRPFFLEGQDLFSTSANLVHTRTIVDPFIGARLTGQIGRTAVGLTVADDRSSENTADGVGAKAAVVIGRARYEFRPESFVGVIVTDREQGRQFSRLAGVDARFRIDDTKNLSVLVAGSDHRDEVNQRRRGVAADVDFRRSGRHLEYGARHQLRSPDFRTDLGFVQRVDIADTEVDASYNFRPEGRVVRWGPEVEYSRIYDHRGELQDERLETGVDAELARNISLSVSRARVLERFAGVDFRTSEYSTRINVSASRRVSAELDVEWGDGVEYSETPVVGRSRGVEAEITFRPSSRVEATFSIEASRLTDPRTDTTLVRQTLYRLHGSYQFSDRLFLRTILERDTGLSRAGANALLTYRVNAGTVAFLGYDDRFAAQDRTAPPPHRLRLTNRAFFTKLSFLWRM